MWGIKNTGIKRQVVDKIRNRFNLSSLSLVYFALFKLVQYRWLTESVGSQMMKSKYNIQVC